MCPVITNGRVPVVESPRSTGENRRRFTGGIERSMKGKRIKKAQEIIVINVAATRPLQITRKDLVGAETGQIGNDSWRPSAH